jgi:hypothetical protein
MSDSRDELAAMEAAICALPTRKDDKDCKTHPAAPHGFLRNASHNAGRYVCECEHWEKNT